MSLALIPLRQWCDVMWSALGDRIKLATCEIRLDTGKGQWTLYSRHSRATFIYQNIFHFLSFVNIGWCRDEFEGILPKGPYLPCVSMAGRALLAGYHRILLGERQGRVYPAYSIPCCWWLGDKRSQGISSHDISLKLSWLFFSFQ